MAVDHAQLPTADQRAPGGGTDTAAASCPRPGGGRPSGRLRRSRGRAGRCTPRTRGRGDPRMTVEEVVLLDEEGRAVGTAPKAEVHHHSTPLHLAFSCYVFDEAGALLLTQRALHKPTWPGVWT